jgi:predicted HAD superfamily Cof-like phosphohydrolase
MYRQLQQLVEFHRVFGASLEERPTAAVTDETIALRVSLIQEELNEYRHAAEARDLVGVADALSDLLYVVLGTYVSHGLQDVAEALFDEVHRSNMSKLDAEGRVLYRADGKVLKSDLWRPPELGAILRSGDKGQESAVIGKR